MTKDEVIVAVEALHKGIRNLRTEVRKVVGNRTRKQTIRNSAVSLSRTWIDGLDLMLFQYGVHSDVLVYYGDMFGALLELGLSERPLVSRLEQILAEILRGFNRELLVPVHAFVPENTVQVGQNWDELKPSVTGAEREYLEDAFKCAKAGHLRGATVLGWCAAVDRMQRVIEKQGFDEFNKASQELKDLGGRFKRFDRVYEVQNLSDFRVSVGDTHLLMALEHMELLESNQRNRMMMLYGMRNQAAHPGEAPITEPGLMWFLSDLNILIFENPEFET